MKTNVIILSLLISLISCKDKVDEKNVSIEKNVSMNDSKNAPYNITDIGDGVKYNYDTLSVDYIKKVKTSLLNRKFKFLDEQKFKDKVFEVYNINVYDYKNKIVALRPAMFTEIAIKEDKFILIEDPETDDSDVINDNLEYYYNSYVFYDDKVALNWLKLNNKQQLIDLVVDYGYSSDKELVKFVFKDFDFDNSVLFHDLIFSNDVNSKKFLLREKILDDIENLVYKGHVEGYTETKTGNGYNSFSEIIKKIRRNPNNYIEPEKYIAFLYEKDLRIGIVGHVESNLMTNTNYKSFLKQNNYFNLERLKDYVENIYGENPDSEDTKIVYKIQDLDGYTNLRKEKNSSSAIIEKVKSGEEIEILDDSGDWWFVSTKSGNKGYVYKSKIKSE
ncbi:SH3 domain-containing protein [Flavobacterium sp. LS1R49]|uniref:SH3 domain-containing protein n=2 Tax=Flavobacterium shii TaxID=2987687 RepID=A0A9X2YSY6_9FLAO|nr:SH3 domain-containing protein [Flavobacterium shii]